MELIVKSVQQAGYGYEAELGNDTLRISNVPVAENTKVGDVFTLAPGGKVKPTRSPKPKKTERKK